ncbi:TetR/AcrR family transcriptional regulator [Actinoplanes sp. TBRC 11911]|uniref:TetR/AcrR family transcriptional regulator n=1 Tax=Actinoplanes sp. TBRC 11911 TaxID=2729386 RepID=UPI001B7D5B4E|nr:TetR/AcrR family transcriptional regulator [Actinoplanes sp. TBRC 11911]
MSPNTANARPGGRAARVRSAVHRAVRELLAEEPAEALTLPVIAERAGVHPTTLYRRWRTIGELLAEVATSRFSGENGELVVPDTGSLRGDLERWTEGVVDDLTDPEGIALLRAAIGAGGFASRACMVDRHAQLAAMLDHERARGGTVPEVGRAADTLLGPLLYRAVFTDLQIGPDWVHDVVRAFLDGQRTG